MGPAYGYSEVAALKVIDIESKRILIRVERDKDRKDRYAMVSPVLLELLREWWKIGAAPRALLARLNPPTHPRSAGYARTS